MIASVSSASAAVTLGYLPWPVQQGSAPQIGVGAGEVSPAGNQQQQPLQSVHDGVVTSALQTHDEASGVVMVPLLLPELLLLLEELVLPELLLLLEELVVPLLLPLEDVVVPLLLPELLDVVPESVSVAPPLDPDPLSSLEEPVGGLELLLQAASPTVDDVPMTTMTWKSFSMFMGHTLPPIDALGT